MTNFVNVHLYQPLSDKYGADHRFLIDSPREAIAALDANFPGFYRDFIAIPEYAMIVDGEPREGEMGALSPISDDLHLIPNVEGSGPGLFIPLLGLAGITGTAATIISGVLFLGALVGLSMLFAPKKPKEVKEEDKKTENYAFTGPENVTIQGTAVPLIYGRVFAGSVVISAGLELGSDLAADVPPPPPTTASSYPTGSTVPPILDVGYVYPPIVPHTITRVVIFLGRLQQQTFTVYGPQGYAWVGTKAITQRTQVRPGVYANVTSNVDYFKGPWFTLDPRKPGYGQTYAWDRIDGFHMYSSAGLSS